VKSRGFTLIEVMLVIGIIAVLAAIAIPNFIQARRASNEASAVQHLRTLATAQSMFQSNDKEQDGASDYALSLAELLSTNLIDSNLASGQTAGYVFAMETASTGILWTADAVPQNQNTGGRRFFVDESGIIRYSYVGRATSASLPIGN